jgi:glycosyltransferase involved in cell wall biosynthesis
MRQYEKMKDQQHIQSEDTRKHLSLNPTVSVVIPAFNAALWISESLESVFAQTYPILEIIVVDDGSSDETKKVIAQYLNRIKYIEVKHQGVSSARNVGIQLARGDWVAFLDADDMWYPEKIQKQVHLITPDVGFIFCWKHEFLNGEVHILRIVEYDKLCCINPLLAILTRFFASPSTVIVKRELLINHGGFDEGNKDGSEDADLWIRLAEWTHFSQVEEALVRYRLHSNSICGRQSHYEYTKQIIGPLLRNRKIFLRNLQITKFRFHIQIAQSYLSISKMWYKKKDIKTAAWSIMCMLMQILIAFWYSIKPSKNILSDE